MIEGKDNCIVHAENIIIATGSYPVEIEKFPYDNLLIHSSTSILSLPKLPKTLAIVGGGYIGCEFASFFHALGVKVTIIEASPSIISTQEKEQILALTKTFKNQGIEIHTSSKVSEIEKKKNHVIVTIDDNEKIQADICLLSIGRSPNTKNINIENANIELDETGYIEVNEKMQTTSSHIYAIGDITGKWMLAHVASHEGIVAANNASNIDMLMHYEAVPSVIFTLPEIASVGLSKTSAIDKGYDIICSSFPLSYLGKAQAANETEGFVSLIVDKETKQILGAHMFGTDASTMIGEMALAISNELTIECVIDTIHPHPTMSEGWLEAALLANNTPIHHPKKNNVSEIPSVATTNTAFQP